MNSELVICKGSLCPDRILASESEGKVTKDQTIRMITDNGLHHVSWLHLDLKQESETTLYQLRIDWIPADGQPIFGNLSYKEYANT